MSPAPVRARAATAQKFPHSWGYWVGLMFVVGGIVLAVFMVVGGIRGFTDDVNDLRRAFDGDLETNLRAGEEVIVYDETDVGIGPLDVTVIRTSDGSEVATKPADQGTSYEIDGRNGEARVAFRVPTSDIYRVEVDTSVGQLARFAVGGDIGNSRANTITSGLLWGGILVLFGIATIIGTMLVHARWRVRHALADQVAAARSTLSTASDSVTSQAERAAAESSAWAQRTVDRARQSLPQSSEPSREHGRAPTWRESLEAQARERLDQVEQRLAAAEPAVTEAASTPEAAQDLVTRIDEALGRVGERVQAGDSLRDIARDERVAARETAQEFSERARTGAESAAARAQQLQQQAAAAARSEQLQGLADDLSIVATTAIDDAVAQAEAGADELAVGLAATATGAVAAATEAGRGRARGALGAEAPTEADVAPDVVPGPPGSSLAVPPALPEPPTSSLPAPPASVLPQPPVPPPATLPAPPVTPEPAPSAEPVTEPVVGAEPVSGVLAEAPWSILAPPPAAGRLAPPPRDIAARTATPAHTTAHESVASRPAFSPLAPPPAAAKPLGISSGRPAATEAAAGLGGGGESVDADDPSSEEDTAEPSAGGPRAFSLAPPPDYGSLTSR